MWLDESVYNVRWLEMLLHALHDEWRLRFNHSSWHYHKAFKNYVQFAGTNTRWDWNMPSTEATTPFPQAMPDDCKCNDPVEAYRNYYRKHKQHLHKWTHRETPNWL